MAQDDPNDLQGPNEPSNTLRTEIDEEQGHSLRVLPFETTNRGFLRTTKWIQLHHSTTKA